MTEFLSSTPPASIGGGTWLQVLFLSLVAMVMLFLIGWQIPGTVREFKRTFAESKRLKMQRVSDRYRTVTADTFAEKHYDDGRKVS